MKLLILGPLLFLFVIATQADEYLLIHRYPQKSNVSFFSEKTSLQREESELFLVQNLETVFSLKSHNIISNINELYDYLSEDSYLHEVYKLNLTKKESEQFLKKLKKDNYGHIFNALQRTLIRSRFNKFDEDEKFSESFDRYKNLPKYLKNLLESGDILVANEFYTEKTFDVHFCQKIECETNDKKVSEKDTDSLLLNLKTIFSDIEDLNSDYINESLREGLISISQDFINLEKRFLIQKDYDQVKMMWPKFFKVIPDNYMIFRNMEEGSYYGHPIRGWLSDLIKHYRNLISRNEYKRLQKHFDSDLDRVGNGVGSVFVNLLGKIFKKRQWVPSLRVATNFRENYLFSNMDKVIDELLAENGMRPGDIILEKDRKANTDILIPGYWVHASIYLGTIKDFKRLGVWDHPEFKKMRLEILKYNSEWRYKLDGEYRNKRSFEDIPWFSESDRPGVGVHPLNKFLQTDGMAVIRPTAASDLDYVRNVLLKSTRYLGLPYDYTHNIKNNQAMTCSKYVLKVFDDLNFNTSVNGPYTTVSPDQISQITESTQARLIMYYEAENEGQLIYSSHQKDESAYQVYLNNLY